jgi:hypothetical protein
MDSATEKLELGLQRLAKAGDDADLLGLALQSIHGALEDFCRATLSADPRLPADQREAVRDSKKIQWKDLLDLMQLYRDLSAQDRELIWRTNGLRTRVAHGGRYTGTRADLDRYATLVQRLCDYTPPARPGRQPSPKPEKQPAAKLDARSPQPADRSHPPPSGPDIPRAVRPRAPAPPQRSRLGWAGTLLALALLFGLAAFVVLRGAAQSAPDPAAAPTSAPPTAAPDLAAAPPEPARATALPRAATVANLEGVPLRVRSDHSLAAETLLTLAEGARVAIVGGPVDADGYTWWNVEVGGQRGWCAGEFLRFDRT